MSNAYEIMLKRRSCKNYKNEAVPEQLIDRVVNAGIHAASGRNFQSPIVLAVTDKETRDALAVQNAALMGMSDFDPFYGAPAVLVVLADKQYPTYVYDGSLVLGNMMIAAEECGLGSCWIHRAKEEFESEEGKALLKKLGIEGDFEGIGHLTLGYSAEREKQPLPRKENRVYKI